MQMTRRDLAAAGAFALAAASVIGSTTADAAEEEAVTKAVDAMRQAQLAQDKAKIEALASDHLSYGHSSGVIQNKTEMIDGVMSRKQKVKSIEYPELKVSIAGDAAIARQLYVSESELDGKTNTIKIGILEVWHKDGGSWKLFARQGYKLATA